MFTAQELAEMAAADAQIEAEFRLTPADLAQSRELDRLAGLSEKQYILVKGVLIGLGADLDAKVS